MNKDQFGEDPAAYFAEDLSLAHRIGGSELDALQVYAIQRRFAAMQSALPPLAALADAARIREIRSLADVTPLLFPHSFYKSYDDYLLDYGCYNDLTDWTQKLTTVDLSGVRDRDFASLDEWIDTLERDAGLMVSHSSGTTGKLSFMSRSTAEVENNARYAKLTVPDWSRREADKYEQAEFSVIWTTFARGRSAVARGAHAFKHGYAATEADFHPLIPEELSADWHYFMLRLNRERANGRAQPAPSTYVLDRMQMMEAMHAEKDAQVSVMLDKIEADLKDKRVVFAGAPFVLNDFAKAGIARGMESAFGPDSAVISFGGLKGRTAEDRMADTILKFSGAPFITNFYVMTEASAVQIGCEEGFFHIVPWVVPFLLDPATGAPLPRDGVRTGRAAYFDLLAKTYWGGIVTADRVTLDWTPCRCGRHSARISPDISRFDDGEGGALPPCPAPDAVIRDLMAQMNR